MMGLLHIQQISVWLRCLGQGGSFFFAQGAHGYDVHGRCCGGGHILSEIALFGHSIRMTHGVPQHFFINV